MRITRVSQLDEVPSWSVAADQDVYEEQQRKEFKFVKRINLTPSHDVDENVLAEECDKIEECSREAATYHYNSTWTTSATQHLREYAIACGLPLNQFKSIDPETLETEIRTASTQQPMTRTASKESQESKDDSNIVLKDVFHLEDTSYYERPDKDNWEQIKGSSKLNDAPLMTSGIKPVRGGEDYNINSNINLAENQNSILNPNVIEDLAKSKVPDTRERLRNEAKAKEDAKIQERAQWEQDAIDKMQGFKAPGSVFATEYSHSHTGLNNQASQRANFKADDMPEFTEGEKLASRNKARRESIQRDVPENDWEHMSKQSARDISPTFAESLAKALKK